MAMRCLAALLAATCAMCENSAAPTVTVPTLGELQGKYASWFSDKVAMFLGIPFAKAPVGELRWMPPQPHGPWKSPRDATKYGDSCVGYNMAAAGGGSSEDCLTLNVVARSAGLTQAPKQPVLVWIYGGTFDTGSSMQFTPENIVSSEAEQSVVVVTLNYRINVFGFLGSRALAARSKDGTTGNYGIQDQRMALVWIRDHISAFGGSGSDVTLFGESAGGNSILHHLVQPASFGLYSKAIMESGTYDSGYSLDDAEALYDAIIEKSGCNTNLECLLNKTSKEVEVAKEAMAKVSKLPELHWGPVVDGVSMTGTPQQLIPAGKFNNKVPILMGTNRDEFAVFMKFLNVSSSMKEEDFDKLLTYLGEDKIKSIKQVYHPSVYSYPADLGQYSQWWWTTMRVATDHGIPFSGFAKGVALGHCSARRIANQLLHGGTPSVHLYNFARPLIGGQVGHGMEIPFVFDMSPFLGLGPGNHYLSDSMIKYWLNFAVSANPSPPGAANAPLGWPSYNPAGDKANIRFDATFTATNITLEHDFRGPACNLWDSIDAATAPIIV